MISPFLREEKSFEIVLGVGLQAGVGVQSFGIHQVVPGRVASVKF